MKHIPRIQIVDDNYLARAMLRLILRNDTHQIVGEANNGPKALECFKESTPDIVLMDIMMSPIYSHGPAEAMLKPQSLTSAQKCSRHRARLRIVAQGVALSSQISSLSASIRNSAIG